MIEILSARIDAAGERRPSHAALSSPVGGGSMGNKNF